MQSFASWVKDKPAAALKAALAPLGATWDQAHRTLAAYNLELRPRGAGLVIADRGGKRFTKASDVSRDFTKGKLEKKLGAYERPGEAIKSLPARQRYQAAPVHRDPKREALWQRYQQDKTQRQDAKRQGLAALKADREQGRQAIQAHFAAKRQALKRQRAIPGQSKKGRYSLLKVERLAAQEALKNEMGKRRRALIDATKALSWNDFLVREAGRDPEALQVLRSRPGAVPTATANAVSSPDASRPPDGLFRHMAYKIDRRGAVTYTLANGAKLRDDGKALRVDSRSSAGVEAALRLAQARYGSALHITGSDEFKARVVAAAVAGKLRITFDDAAMEGERRRRLAQRARTPAQAPIRQPERRGIER